jgi:predicted flap endonuclease-1-like 5' DNA nuclease
MDREPQPARIERRADEIARLLPGVLQRTRTPGRSDPLSALLSAMALLQLGPEVLLEELDAFYDPDRAPLASLIYLAYWVDLEPLIAPGQPPGLAWRRRDDWEKVVTEGIPTGLAQLRALVGEAVPLLGQRGTARGLERFLERATGVQGFEVVESRVRPFHIHVVYPVRARRYIDYVRRVVELQKPAYLTYDLVVYYALAAIEGIGEAYAAKLEAAGIRNTRHLLERGVTRSGRAEIAHDTGISLKRIRRWVGHSDLMRVDGVGPQYAELLYAAGVDTVPALARRDPRHLHQQLRTVNRGRRRVRRLPSLTAVRDWIEQAGQLLPVIRY